MAGTPSFRQARETEKDLEIRWLVLLNQFTGTALIREDVAVLHTATSPQFYGEMELRKAVFHRNFSMLY